MIRCWASVLGGCSEEQSAEHYFTRGLCRGRTVLVGGFDWLGGERKEIGIDSFTIKNLCRRHNADLSHVDTGAIRLFQTIEELIRVQQVRLRFKRKRFSNFVKRQADGRVFERWAKREIRGIVQHLIKREKYPSMNAVMDVCTASYLKRPEVWSTVLQAREEFGFRT